jgi:hypothetical protein
MPGWSRLGGLELCLNPLQVRVALGVATGRALGVQVGSWDGVEKIGDCGIRDRLARRALAQITASFCVKTRRVLRAGSEVVAAAIAKRMPLPAALNGVHRGWGVSRFVQHPSFRRFRVFRVLMRFASLRIVSDSLPPAISTAFRLSRRLGFVVENGRSLQTRGQLSLASSSRRISFMERA